MRGFQGVEVTATCISKYLSTLISAWLLAEHRSQCINKCIPGQCRKTAFNRICDIFNRSTRRSIHSWAHAQTPSRHNQPSKPLRYFLSLVLPTYILVQANLALNLLSLHRADRSLHLSRLRTDKDESSTDEKTGSVAC